MELAHGEYGRKGKEKDWPKNSRPGTCLLDDRCQKPGSCLYGGGQGLGFALAMPRLWSHHFAKEAGASRQGPAEVQALTSYMIIGSNTCRVLVRYSTAIPQTAESKTLVLEKIGFGLGGG